MLHQGSVCVNHLICSSTPSVFSDKGTNYHSNGAQRSGTERTIPADTERTRSTTWGGDRRHVRTQQFPL